MCSLFLPVLTLRAEISQTNQKVSFRKTSKNQFLSNCDKSDRGASRYQTNPNESYIL